MSDSLAAASDRICKHMNDDHADAIALYAQVFGGYRHATAASMQSIDPEGMNLMIHADGETVPLRIPFDHLLQDAEDAHHTLIDMVKQARSQL